MTGCCTKAHKLSATTNGGVSGPLGGGGAVKEQILQLQNKFRKSYVEIVDITCTIKDKHDSNTWKLYIFNEDRLYKTSLKMKWTFTCFRHIYTQ